MYVRVTGGLAVDSQALAQVLLRDADSGPPIQTDPRGPPAPAPVPLLSSPHLSRSEMTFCIVQRLFPTPDQMLLSTGAVSP